MDEYTIVYIEIPEGYWVCSHDVEWVCEEL